MAAALFTRVIARTEAEFAAGLAAHSTSGKLFFLFTGAKVAETGQSWCPDCVDAAPVLDAAFAKVTEPTTLIEVPLVRDEYKGNASHWARTHPAMKLQRIPTLFQHTKAGKPLALVEDQCKDAELVEELVLAESK